MSLKTFSTKSFQYSTAGNSLAHFEGVFDKISLTKSVDKTILFLSIDDPEQTTGFLEIRSDFTGINLLKYSFDLGVFIKDI